MRDLLKLLAFPIVVGLVIVLAQFAIERYKTTRKASVIIEGPFAFAQIYELFDKAKFSFEFEYEGQTIPNPEPQQPAKPGTLASPTGLKVTQRVKVNELQVYKITIRNTGNSPLRNLPVRLVFENASVQFRFFAAKHKTIPQREFGDIKEDFSEVSSPRFVYQLLNPGDEDVITFLASEKSSIKAYSKGEGVSFDVTSASENNGRNWSVLIAVSALAGTILGILSTFIGRFFGVNLRE